MKRRRLFGSRAPPAGLLFGCLFCAALSFAPRPAGGQEVSGSAWAAVAGGALGLYSGAVLGTVGALVPCSQTYAGVRCVRTGLGAGGAVGLLSGIAIGDADADEVWRDYEGAGIGLLVGSAVTLGLKPFVERWSWGDVAAGALVGSAVGAAGKGAGIGLVAGSALGVALWQLVPSIDLPDAISVGLFGMAAGGLATWVIRAVDARDRADASGASGEASVLSFSLPVRGP
jgi:hypothetical protein